MTLFDLILIAISLSMDAFAVSICKGLSVRKVSFRHALICGVWFGGFQGLMPALGYFLGDRFSTLLTRFGPWVAFFLLAIIGANMVKESFGEDESLDDDYSPKAMLPLAVATSIDAFAVGVGFAAVQVQILPAVTLIGCITCVLSGIGVKVGAIFGDKYRAPAERLGGIVLILIGLKTLLSGLGIL
ncbi:manganese efflux pump [Gemmiger formicilis]|uniref:Putative manganese efflux pump MntP n=1 Tax=Subdoligranulum variabile TaxID=214851 RepID=A0A921IPG5_9FIRM|nr:manganese efflux pump MntP family protein [Gemmiger formicilis]MBM6899804.1 manganese efflux pump [Gemmiger formicilis]HJG29543.1 manganese efflux pump MntP family protein [Subdoligranulum variabile]